MKLPSPIAHRHARIEIIPLIDIMFFLLASFMMVSLSQTHMKGINVNLPSQSLPPPDKPKDFVSIQVREGDAVYVDGRYTDPDEVEPILYRLHQANADLKVSISAEMLALHGDVIRVLDQVRHAGVKKVGYQIRTAQPQGAAPPGGAPPPPPHP
jgi:biopolymer transport protein ExbD